jgi:hypothetical protein
MAPNRISSTLKTKDSGNKDNNGHNKVNNICNRDNNISNRDNNGSSPILKWDRTMLTKMVHGKV